MRRNRIGLALLLSGVALAGCQRPLSGSAGAVAATAAGAMQPDRLSILRAAPDTPDQAGFSLADRPRQFVFPQDHGAHPLFRHEWWYFTGQLQGAAQTFGFELTVFRLALRPPQATMLTGWQAQQVYAAHFAVTDVSRGRFFNATRYARDALNLAGAAAQPFDVHVADWSVAQVPDGVRQMPLHWRLQAADGDYALDLDLSSTEQPVLNGDAGVSRKADAPGAASYYYSMPRLHASGRISRNAVAVPVTGLAWLDREWGSGSLGVDQQGWDWFALQLDDGGTLMFYALRGADGRRDAHSAGTFVDAAGHAVPLRNEDVQITVHGSWDSPRGGRYPAQWTLQVPALDLRLQVKPLLADQELSTQPRYWEGAVQATGQRRGAAIGAHGYVELVGYAQDQASPSVPSATSAPTH